MRLAAVAAALIIPSVATANPITFGVTAGLHQDKVDPDHEANDTIGLFGRIGFSKRISGQLEVQKIENDSGFYDAITVRTGTALLVVDLIDSTDKSRHGRLVPTLMVGAGLDRADTQYDSMSGHHFEGGFGLEYRATNGITVGANLRMGGRSVDNNEVYAQPVLEGDAPPRALYLPVDSLREGEYRSGRITVGIVF